MTKRIVWDEPGKFDPTRNARWDDLHVGILAVSRNNDGWQWAWEMFSMSSTDGPPEGFGYEKTEALAAYEFEKFFNLYMKNTGRV